MKHANTPVTLGQGVTKRTTSVTASVIDEQKLEIGKILFQEAADTTFHVSLHVIDRNYDRKVRSFRLCYHIFFQFIASACKYYVLPSAPHPAENDISASQDTSQNDIRQQNSRTGAPSDCNSLVEHHSTRSRFKILIEKRPISLGDTAHIRISLDLDKRTVKARSNKRHVFPPYVRCCGILSHKLHIRRTFRILHVPIVFFLETEILVRCRFVTVFITIKSHIAENDFTGSSQKIKEETAVFRNTHAFQETESACLDHTAFVKLGERMTMPIKPEILH